MTYYLREILQKLKPVIELASKLPSGNPNDRPAVPTGPLGGTPSRLGFEKNASHSQVRPRGPKAAYYWPVWGFRLRTKLLCARLHVGRVMRLRVRDCTALPIPIYRGLDLPVRFALLKIGKRVCGGRAKRIAADGAVRFSTWCVLRIVEC